MNHPSEWKKNYHPKLGKHVYKHKGTGVITDFLFKIGALLPGALRLGKVEKKPLLSFSSKLERK